MDLDLLGCRREPTTRKGARGRATAAEMAAMVDSGGKPPRREQHLRPEQIEALRLKREPKDLSVTCLDQEDEEGNVEYKFRIKDPHPMRLQQLITQMKFRLSEGNGECFYYIGVEDNGYPKGLEPQDLAASIATLQHMASSLGSAVTLISYLPAAWGRKAALMRVASSAAQEACHTDLRIVVAGSVDAGKSTLVAVLTHGSGGRPLLDNGRGLARMNVFRHKHEMQSGRTSSICHQLLGYDVEGRVINYSSPASSPLTPAEITSAACKVLTFLDMGGHEKYLKTALYGMTALLPHYGLLAVCAVGGLGRIAREHLAVAVALEVPVAVVVTKVELVCAERLAAVVGEVRQLVALTLRHESAAAAEQQQGAAGAGAGAASSEQRVEDASPLVTSEAEALCSARVLCELHADSLASPTARGALRVHMPIFPVSAVTGAGLPVLHAFLNALQPGTAPLKGAGSGPLSAAATSAGAAADGGCCCGRSSSGGGAAGSAGGSSPRGVDRSSFTSASSFCMKAPEAAAVLAAAAEEEELPNPPGWSAAPHPQQQQQLLYGPAVVAVAASATTADAPTTASRATIAAATAIAAVEVPAEAQAVHFQVDGTFEVEGVGSVVSGTLVSGMVRLGQQLVLGPTGAAGDFVRVVVRQLQRSHVQVQQVRAGQTCTIAISPAAVEAEEAGTGCVGRGVSGGTETVQLPLGRSPSVVVPGAGGATAALVSNTFNGGAGGRGMEAPAGDFDDALAAAQSALELCLTGGSSDVEDGGTSGMGCGADDDLFGFDAAASDVPSPPQPASAARCASAAAALQIPRQPSAAAATTAPSSSSSSRPLHSTTSFCADTATPAAAAAGWPAGSRSAAGSGPLSMSAPTRSMSVGEGLSRKGAGAGAAAGAGGSSWSPFGAMTPPRKGAVLLEPALQPRTSWTFEAVLILLGGHWPPRGLLSGRWPPAGVDEVGAPPHPEGRGLPPPPQASGAVLEGGGGGLQANGKTVGAGTAAAVATAARRQQRRQRRQRSAAGSGGTYVTVVHCGSVRQPAHVLMMQELFEEEEDLRQEQEQQLWPQGQEGEEAHGGPAGVVQRVTTGTANSSFSELRVSASTRAAAALLQSARNDQGAHDPQQQHRKHSGAPLLAANVATSGVNGSSSGNGATRTSLPAAGSPASTQHPHASEQDLGCLVRVVLRWQHRPEWLREGAKLLLRDRCDGRVAGAGFVRRVLL
ncbi:hypothetical protein Agub_g4451 [Astrephomene gubernaculifera]|uniref:Tr-type G domain-containing protein n=1 Tax=Astrephomene gubernaculifera TaxID=47775 RepID=A0AAD3DK70_9CHLO|nr:hypothetical protein Agub_g4451 [Astrephomene gubernaculifera]